MVRSPLVGKVFPAATVLVTSFLLGGCTGPSATPVEPHGGRAALGGHSDQDEVLPEPLPSPTWDESARTDATAAATAVMEVFADPGADPGDWWVALSPLLAPTAAAAYANTDPANVPASEITGPARQVEESSAYLAPVEVPTDVGTYLVLLSREGQGSPWLAEKITPPEEVAGT